MKKVNKAALKTVQTQTLEELEKKTSPKNQNSQENGKGNAEPQEDLVSLLLEEREDLLDQVENRDKMIDEFKEEIRKIKTLSQYYPDNKDLILEEGEGSQKGRDSIDGEGGALIVSTNSLNLENEKPKSIGLRGSYDRRNDRKNLLRQSNFIPSKSPKAGNNELYLMTSMRTPSPDVTHQNAKSMDMDSTSSITKSRSGFNKPLINIQSNISDLRVSNLSAPDFTHTPRGPSKAPQTTPIPTLIENFMGFLRNRNDDEVYKFAEYTFLQIEKAIHEKDRMVNKLKQKNFTLVSVLADYKEKEKKRADEEVRKQRTKDRKANEKTSLEEKKKRLENIKIPKNLEKFKENPEEYQKAGNKGKEENQKLLEKERMNISINRPNIQNHTTLNTGPQTQYFNVSINPYNGGNTAEKSSSKKNKFSYFFVKKGEEVRNFYKGNLV
jgi:hypothetical protein